VFILAVLGFSKWGVFGAHNGVTLTELHIALCWYWYKNSYCFNGIFWLLCDYHTLYLFKLTTHLYSCACLSVCQQNTKER